MKFRFPRLWLRACAAACGFLFFAIAMAQGYPAKPVRVIVPVPAGSGMDVIGRIASEKLAQNIGVPFIVDNISGAAGNIGGAAAAHAAPDGYTLLVSTDSMPLSALTYTHLNYDPMRDVKMFGTIAKAVFILSVTPSLPAKTAEEFVAFAKSKPGSIAYGTAGVGSPHHIVMEMFAQANGLALLHVPYKGSSDMVTALMSGTIQAAMGLPGSFAPHVRSGKFRALAVVAPKRVAAFPEVPALPERAVVAVDYQSWWGMFAPAGTPRPVVERLHAELGKVVRDKAYVDEKLSKIGLEPFESASPEAADALVRSYYDKLAPVIKKAGIKAE